MNATRFEFRFRVPIIVLLYIVGFAAPWHWLIVESSSGESWGVLIAQLNRTGLLSFNHSFVLINVAMLICTFAGAGLRWWATASIGARTMMSNAMLAEKIIVAGAYRYLRNPLYLGAWLLAIPLAMLMRPSGAAFLMIALTIFLLRLAGAEQAFLSQQLKGYGRYRESVAAIFPKGGPKGGGGIVASETKPEWLPAAVAESYGILLAVTFAIFCWSFNVQLLERCAIIAFGVSLVLNAALTTRRNQVAT